jgi:hypothetical protein
VSSCSSYFNSGLSELLRKRLTTKPLMQRRQRIDHKAFETAEQIEILATVPTQQFVDARKASRASLHDQQRRQPVKVWASGHGRIRRKKVTHREHHTCVDTPYERGRKEVEEQTLTIPMLECKPTRRKPTVKEKKKKKTKKTNK